MSVTLKTTTLKYKDENGQYHDVDCLKCEDPSVTDVQVNRTRFSH